MKTTIRNSTLTLALTLAGGSAFAQNANIPNEAPDFASCAALRVNRYEPGPSGAGVRRDDRASAPVSTDLSAQPTSVWCDAYYVLRGQYVSRPTVVLQNGQQVLVQAPPPPAQPTVRVVTRDRVARDRADAAMGVAVDARARATAMLASLAELTQRTTALITELRQGQVNETRAREAADQALAAHGNALQAAIDLERAEREATNGALIAQLRQQAAGLRALVETVNALRRANRFELSLMARGEAHATGASAGSGSICVGWNHRLTPGVSLLTRGCYGLASQSETPGAGPLHNGNVSLQAVIGDGVVRFLGGLGGAMRGNDAVGLVGSSVDARAGLRIQAAEQLAIDLVGTAGVGNTHGRNGQGVALHSEMGFNGGGEFALVWTP